MKTQTLTPEIEKQLRMLKDQHGTAPTSRWVLDILLSEIDLLRLQLDEMKKLVDVL